MSVRNFSSLGRFYADIRLLFHTIGHILKTEDIFGINIHCLH